ncbi:MAG: SET domain-containing protein [Patescibacteria group bacterium]
MGKRNDERKYAVRRGLHGLGLFSLRSFRKGRKIIEYIGKVIDDAEADRRSNRYIFGVQKDVNIDGATRRNLARYVNHACRPNCEDRIVGSRVFYIARRNIKTGEELTVDYGKEYFDHYIAPKGCRCRAKRHRKASLVE